MTSLRSRPDRRLWLLLAAIAACSGSSDAAGPTTPASSVARVDVTPDAPSIGVGGSVQLSATPRDASGAAVTGRSIVWSSTQTAIATVDGSGTVHGVAAGATSVTAAVDGTVGISTVLVRIAAASITIAPTAQTLLVGQTVQLTPTVRDAGGNSIVGATVNWSSSDDHIATVSASGLVTAVAPGGATITGASDGRSATATITVNPSADQLTARLAAGEIFNCAVNSAGAAHCWGLNLNGSLGTGVGVPGSNVPVAVIGGLTFRAIAAGASVCAITTAGKLYCWGDNSDGQLGNGTISGSQSPVATINGDSFVAVSAGDKAACAVNALGQAFCWGNNQGGQIGDGTTTTRTVPTAVSGGLSFANVSSGSISCGVTFAHVGYCWGTSQGGQLGSGSMVATQKTPTAISGSLALKLIRAGSLVSCGLTTAGAAYCWGDGEYGQLGNNGVTSSAVPVAVSGGLVFSDIEIGSETVCGLTANGTAYCWGTNNLGALGDGTTTRRLGPAAVAGGITFSSISVGINGACGRSTAGVVYCWGANIMGEIGNGTTASSLVPVQVSGTDN